MKSTTLLFPTFLLATTMLVSGCQSFFTNLTSTNLAENPSSIYTFTFSSDLPNGVVEETLEAEIAINGEVHPMSRVGDDIFEFEFRLPEGQSEVRYFYRLRYNFIRDGRSFRRNEQSEIYTSYLSNRYVIQLEASRGPVGARIPVVGRGFSEFDTIVINGQEIPTEFISPNSMAFNVPSLPQGTYEVALRTGQGDIVAQPFTIDASELTVLPGSISIPSGGRELLIITVGFEAPAGGLYIDVTTDVPDSVIMPEVIIPEGARSVNVPLEGGAVGTGSLFIQAPGYGEIAVPLEVY